MNQDLKLSNLFQNQDENIETQPTPPTSNQFNQNFHTKNKSQSSLFYQRDKNNNLFYQLSSKPNGQLSQKFQSQLKIQQNAKFDKIQLQRFKLDRKLYPRLIDIDSQLTTFIPLQTNSFHNGFQQNSVMKLSDFKTNIYSEGILNTPSPVRFDQAKIKQKIFQFYSPQQRDITKMEQLPFYQRLPSNQSTSNSQQNFELLQHRVPHLSLKAIGLKKHLKQQIKQRNVKDFGALNLPKVSTSQTLTKLLSDQNSQNNNSQFKPQTRQPLIKVIVQQNLQFKENKKQGTASDYLNTQDISSNDFELILNKNDNTTTIQGSQKDWRQDLSSLTNKLKNKQVSSKMVKQKMKQEQTLSALSSKMKLSKLFEEENVQEKRQRFIVIEESFDSKSLINFGNIIKHKKIMNSKFILGIQIL